MSSRLVLITGVSGHVGFRVLVEALSQGYRVRAVIRKSEQADQIKNTASVQPHAQNLEFVVIKDLLPDGAFDKVLDGVDAIVHVASPIPIDVSDDYKRDIIDPALRATLSLLKSAAKAPSIKRVIITSSVVPFLSLEYIKSGGTTNVLTAYDTAPLTDVNATFSSPQEAYIVAKSHALVASEDFIAKEKPQFDLISIMPSMVIGRTELSTTTDQILRSTNEKVLDPLIGKVPLNPGIGASVHVDDVAKLHIDALKPEVAGNQRLLCSSHGPAGINWEDVKDVVRRLYSEHVSPTGLFPLTGPAPTFQLHLDTSPAEKILGRPFIGFEEQVRSAVDNYIELATKVQVTRLQE